MPCDFCNGFGVAFVWKGKTRINDNIVQGLEIVKKSCPVCNKIKEHNMDAPDKPGLYWARVNDKADAVVEITGEFPFLKRKILWVDNCNDMVMVIRGPYHRIEPPTPVSGTNDSLNKSPEQQGNQGIGGKVLL